MKAGIFGNMMLALSLTVPTICLSSCDNEKQQLEDTLVMAGERRGEYEQIIEFFSDTQLHMRGTKWIVYNMPYNQTLDGSFLGDYLEYYHLFATKGEAAKPLIDSMQSARGNFSVSLLKARNDLLYINIDSLREDMALAYRTREEMPWSVNVTEEDFIRYVLPYRIGDERLGFWRGIASKLVKEVTDSLKKVDCDDPLEAARAIMRKWNKKAFQWTSQLPSGPALGATNLTDKVGTCREFAHGVVYLMRAAGIPAGIDMVPIRGENNSSHSWPFIIGKKGKTYVTCTENTDFVSAPEFDIIAAKIYRQEFGLNRELDSSLFPDRRQRPDFFMLPKITDVTKIYKPGLCCDVVIEKVNFGEGPLYLASWGNRKWVAVDVSSSEREGRFCNVSAGVISVVSRMKNGKLEAVSNPFEIVCDENKLRYIEPSKEWKTITAYAKFPLNERNGDLVYRCKGVIEAADNPQFYSVDTIFEIKEAPKRRVVFAKAYALPRPHRYYRYRGADGTYCNIAEVALYEAGNNRIALKGKVFGTPGSYGDNPIHCFDKVFDGDIYTSFDYSEASGGWSAIDVGLPVTVDRIMYVPRNRDNFVREGDEYELFWFENCCWHSAGKKTADSDSIDFEVPVGTIYFMQNLTRGKDERFFEYNFTSREQRFW